MVSQMKIYFSILIIALLSLSLINGKRQIDYTIIPGQGFDSIRISVSTKKDIEKYLGKGKLEKREMSSSCCRRSNGSKDYIVPVLCYDSLGVEFLFYNEDIKKPIQWITFNNKNNWKIQGDLKINHTTRKEVCEKFKHLSDNGLGTLNSDSLGIYFIFKSNYYKGLPTDTLIEVDVFEKD